MGTPPENLETQAAAPAEASGGGRQEITQQQLLIVLGVVLVIILALVYFFFLRGGDEEEAAAPPTAEGVPAPEETTPPEEDKTGAEKDGDEGDVETFEVFAPRDPFDPLVSEGGGGGGGEAPVDDTGDGVVDGGGPDEAPPTTDEGDRIGDHRVKVIDVYVQGGNDRAQIQVDGTVYTVDEGEQFASNFELVSASGRCATILFGDDEFTLCEGEEILK